MFARQGMNRQPTNGPRPTHCDTLAQVRAVCTKREPTGRVIIVIVAEREDKREGEERERREKRAEKEKERKREQERQTESKKDRESGKPIRV